MLVVWAWERKNARCTMVNEEEEDIVLDCTAKNFAVSTLRVSHHNRHEFLCVHIITCIVD